MEPKRDEVEEKNETTLASNTLEQVVSQLLMQNQEFQKILNRQRKLIKDETSGVWLKQNICDKPKADSLPRSFQLNEEVVKEVEEAPKMIEDSILNKSEPVDTSVETHDEEDDEDMYPDHKIYRKSTIRFSLVQRFRAMISEESQRVNKLPSYKQGSELMGAKIAQPDYVDPQKLFSASSSVNSSQYSLNTTTDSVKSGNDSSLIYEEITDVKNKHSIDTGQRRLFSPILNRRSSCDNKPSVNSSHKTNFWSKKQFSKDDNCINFSDSYYEKQLERDLRNEYIANHRISEESVMETFKNSKNLNNSHSANHEIIKPPSTKILKRPMKPPPPIPAKPTRLNPGQSPAIPPKPGTRNANQGWVKTVVGRFE